MENQLKEIISSKGLQDISIDIVESILDNEITNEALKEIPIIKSLVAIRNVHNSFSDRIFIKKALTVLLELGNLDSEKRQKFLDDLDDKFTSGSEKILLAIEKLDTYEKCKIFGRLSLLRAENKIDVDDFLRLTKVIQDAYIEDLFLIKNLGDGRNKITEEEYYPLISLGLIFQERSRPTPITKKKTSTFFDEETYEGGQIEFYYYLTLVGSKLLKHFDDLFPEENE